MPASAAARRVAATPARRATASRAALKPRPRPAPPRGRAVQRQRPTASTATRSKARRPKGAASRTRTRRGNTPVTGFVPVVVGRTAGAVGDIADSGVVVRMTRGRIWIGVLGALLVGIVALNVQALDLNAASSEIARQTDGLKRANSALEAQIAGELSNDQVQAAAERVGLAMPEPGAIRYLHPGRDAASIAARRLADGAFTLGTVAPAITEMPAPVEPEVAPVEEAPVTEAPAETVMAPPTDPAAAPTATAGGVVAP
jgi:hypothetical protein